MDLVIFYYFFVIDAENPKWMQQFFFFFCKKTKELQMNIIQIIIILNYIYCKSYNRDICPRSLYLVNTKTCYEWDTSAIIKSYNFIYCRGDVTTLNCYKIKIYCSGIVAVVEGYRKPRPIVTWAVTAEQDTLQNYIGSGL